MYLIFASNAHEYQSWPISLTLRRLSTEFESIQVGYVRRWDTPLISKFAADIGGSQKHPGAARAMSDLIGRSAVTDP
jgi:hypothetical protein